MNFYTADKPIQAIAQHHWDRFISKLVEDKQEILVEAFQGSSARVCGRTLLIFLDQERIENTEYLDVLLADLRDYMELILNDESLSDYLKDLKSE
ncbi:MAG: hypothetical protein ABFD08_16460 [Syntrophomonas sp.]